jgi:hypothetical protein
VSVGAGTHFRPEDQPEAISRALAAWLGYRVRPAASSRSSRARRTAEDRSLTWSLA